MSCACAVPLLILPHPASGEEVIARPRHEPCSRLTIERDVKVKQLGNRERAVIVASITGGLPDDMIS